MKIRKLYFCLTGVAVLGCSGAFAAGNAPDSIKIDIQAAEQRFVQQNLSILQAKYDVEIAKTNILQAQLWYNPNISYGQTLYNYSTGKLFDVSNNDNGTGNGEWNVQLQQLLSYAGRHTNLVKLNKIDAERAQFTFEEVVRALKLELYKSFSTVYADQQKRVLLSSQVKALDTLINSIREQVKLGVSSKNDLVRLQAEREDDMNQLISVEAELADAEADLKVLLHYPAAAHVAVTSGLPKVNSNIPPLATMIDAAHNNRSDLKYARKTVDYQVQNLKLQRSLAYPDLTIGAEYDRAGGAGYNYTGISLSSDIPLFNRNQGQIKAAQYQVKQAGVADSLAMMTVESQVGAAYTKLMTIKTHYDNVDKAYGTDLEGLEKNALSNYNKKLISLLEFLDQVRAYTSAKSDLIDLDTNYFNAIQNLNYQVGTSILK